MKQIVEFSRPNDDGSAEIELVAYTEGPKQTDEMVKELLKDDKITLDFVDGDTIRATMKRATQDDLKALIEDGWSFNED